jgi:hypothetical protein
MMMIMMMIIIIIIIIIIERPQKYTGLKEEITNMATECSLRSTISLTHKVYYPKPPPHPPTPPQKN